MINLKKPTKDLVRNYIDKFTNPPKEKFKHYPYQEKAVIKLKEEFPNNIELVEILLKVGILNSFYSTSIFKPFAVAQRILDLNIDKRLKQGDPSLIKEIASNTISGKKKNFYSFATKYCSMHNPEAYPIYDSYIEWLLLLYKKQYGFSDFKREDLKKYEKFIEIIKEFQKFFNLNFSPKEIDQFLWMYAKEIKPNSY